MLLVKRLKLLNSRLSVKGEGDFVVIPLSRELPTEEVSDLKMRLHGAEMASDGFEVSSKGAKTLRETIRDRLPFELLARLPRSLDIVGEVAIVEIPKGLEAYKGILGEAVIESRRGVKTVLAKAGAVSGEFRVREFETIAGSGKTETVYREHGCIYYLDPTKVYFSPRLSTERLRVARKVRSGEVVVDLFAGVGPFSILIAKQHSDAVVYAVDANPDAIRFLEKNTVVNRVNNVFPLLGDARKVAMKLSGAADRIVMNLPEQALEFMNIACEVLKPSGGTVHYYGFEAEPNALEKAEDKLRIAVSKLHKSVSILEHRVVRSVAPHEWQVALDALIL